MRARARMSPMLGSPFHLPVARIVVEIGIVFVRVNFLDVTLVVVVFFRCFLVVVVVVVVFFFSLDGIYR